MIVVHTETVPGHRIALRFTDFEVERSDNCLYDRLTVWDGRSSERRQSTARSQTSNSR